jgi:hypothetical protein
MEQIEILHTMGNHSWATSFHHHRELTAKWILVTTPLTNQKGPQSDAGNQTPHVETSNSMRLFHHIGN